MSARPSGIADAARVVGSGLALWAGVELIPLVFVSSTTAVVILQASLAIWGAGPARVAWSDPSVPLPAGTAIRTRVATGAALGLAAAAVVVGVALSVHSAAFAGMSLAAGPLALGLLVATLGAVRDEILLRGVAIRAVTGLLGSPATLLVCGGVAAAARFGFEGTLTPAIAADGFRGIALAALWIRGRGGWIALGANTAWSFAFGTGIRGALFDVRFATEPDAGLPAIVVLALASAAAAWWVRPHFRPGPRAP
jgi:hypothetical protein